MRISELADRSGLPVATIKFYLRKELLPPGETVSKTQASYDESHLQRLRLIRALREIADLPVATIATVLGAVDDESLPLLDLLRLTQTAVARPAAYDVDTGPAETLLDELGWQLLPGSALVASLAGVLAALADQHEKIDTTSLKPWAEAAWSVAEAEVGYISADLDRASAARRVTVGTVIYGELLAQLRLAAQEAVSVSRFRAGASGPEPTTTKPERPASESPNPNETADLPLAKVRKVKSGRPAPVAQLGTSMSKRGRPTATAGRRSDGAS
ncbi:MAG TPA: MerR family transcriptional regulator [Jatrophihabitans sp.]|nr:MerR family transcriptional regulator [Jatrophihabitans sp.]